MSHNEIFYNILTAEDTTRTGYLIYKSWLKYAKNEEELNRVKSYKNRPFEELYDLEMDSHEFHNLSEDLNFSEVKKRLSLGIPTKSAAMVGIPQSSPYNLIRHFR